MRLEEAVARLEALLPCVEGIPVATSPTGEPYVTLSIGGRIYEGERHIFTSSPEHAVQCWYENVLKYWDERKAEWALRTSCNANPKEPQWTLYWRILPQLDSVEASIYLDGFVSERHSIYKVYSRLLISDRPVIWPTLEAYMKAKDEEDHQKDVAQS